MVMVSRLQELFDRQQLYDVLARYCRGADSRNPAMIKDCYWPEAVDDHGVMTGNAHEFVDATQEGMAHMFLNTRHMLGQVYYDINGDRAQVESYLIAYHRVVNNPVAIEMLFGSTYLEEHRDAETDSHDFLGGGRYLDEFERRNGEWRIIRRIATSEWEITQPASLIMKEGALSQANGAEAKFGSRAPSDD